MMSSGSAEGRDMARGSPLRELRVALTVDDYQVASFMMVAIAAAA